MSYNGGGSLHKRSLDNAPHQGPGGYQGGSADNKRSRPEMGAGGGGKNLSIYGSPGGNGGSQTISPATGSSGNHPLRPGLEACVHFGRTGNSKFGPNGRYDHLVNEPSSSNSQAGIRNGTGEGREVVAITLNSDGPSLSTQQPRQSGGQQQQQESNTCQTKEHYSSHSSSQHHRPSTSLFQPYSQQPQQDQPQQLPQQGATRQFAQRQGPNPSGVGGNPDAGGYNGNAHGEHSSSASNMSLSVSSIAEAQMSVPGKSCSVPSPSPGLYNQGYVTSGSSTHVSSPSRRPVSAVADRYGAHLGMAGSSEQASACNNPPQTQHSWIGSSAMQQSGGVPGPSWGIGRATVSASNAGGWVYDPATGGYRMAPAPILGGISRGTGPSTSGLQQQRGDCMTGTAGPVQSNNGNPFESSSPKATKQGCRVSGSPRMEFKTGSSSSASHGALYGQAQTVGGSVTTDRNGGEPTSGNGGVGAGAPASASVAQPNIGVTPKNSSRYTQAPGPGAAATNYGSAQSSAQFVSVNPSYGDLSGSGTNFGQPSQVPPGSHCPEQQVGGYPRVDSSITGSPAQYGGISSSVSRSPRSTSSGGMGRDSCRPDGGSRGPGCSETTGSNSGATSSDPSPLPSSSSGVKGALGSSSLTYGSRVSSRSDSAERKDASQSVAEATLQSVASVPPGPLYSQQKTTTMVTGCTGLVTKGVIGYGPLSTSAPHAVLSTIEGANGTWQPQYAQHQPQQVPPQQAVVQQQQPLGVAGHCMVAPQGQQPQQQAQKWQQQGIQQTQQPLQQQPSVQSQPTIGQPPNQGCYVSFTAGGAAPALPAPVPQQQPGYTISTISPFGQPTHQPPHQQHEQKQQVSGGPSLVGVEFSDSSRPGGIFQPNGQGPQPHSSLAGAPIFNHPVPGSGSMPQRYDHPYHRVRQIPLSEESACTRTANVVQQQDRTPCDVYLNESARGVSHPDPNQLPPCGFYAGTGKCASGMKGKFDHPQHNPNNKTPGSGSSGPGSVGARTGGESSVRADKQNSGSGPTSRIEPSTSSSMRSKLKGRPTEVAARHILIKHKGSRRPASWQDPSGVAIKQRTRAEASTILENLRAGIETEEDFSEVAMRNSDCSSAKRGGDLSSFRRGSMQRAFEDAAFGLEIGGVSGVVATDSGMHLIMRTA